MSTEDIRQRIEAALSGEFEGRIAQSFQLADEAYTAAEQAGERALQTKALVQKARALDCRQTATARGAAEELYRQALDIATKDGDAAQTAVIWRRLALLAIRMDPDTARALEHWEKHGAAVAPLPAGDLERARNFHLRSEIHYRNAEYSDAESNARLAIGAVGPAAALTSDQQVDVSRYRMALAKALEAQGLIDDAIAEYKQIEGAAGGPLTFSHADLVTYRMNYGLALKKSNRPLAARKMLEMALNSIPAELLGQTLDAGIIHSFLSDLSYSEPRKAAEAADHGQKALDIYEAIGAPDHRKAEARTNIGNAALKDGAFEAACRSYKAALELRQGRLVPDHYQLGVNEGSLAEALVGLGRYAEAESHVEEARRILEGPSYNPEALRWIVAVHTRVLDGLKRGA